MRELRLGPRPQRSTAHTTHRRISAPVDGFDRLMVEEIRCFLGFRNPTSAMSFREDELTTKSHSEVRWHNMNSLEQSLRNSGGLSWTSIEHARSSDLMRESMCLIVTSNPVMPVSIHILLSTDPVWTQVRSKCCSDLSPRPIWAHGYRTTKIRERDDRVHYFQTKIEYCILRLGAVANCRQSNLSKFKPLAPS